MKQSRTGYLRIVFLIIPFALQSLCADEPTGIAISPQAAQQMGFSKAKVTGPSAGNLFSVSTTDPSFQPFACLDALSSLPGIGSAIDILTGITITNLKISAGVKMPQSLFFYVSGDAYTSEVQGLSLVPSVTISGDTTILNVKVHVEVSFFVGKDGAGMYVKGSLPNTWKVSDCIPALKGTIIDQLALSKAQIVASTTGYRDPSLSLYVPAGIGFGCSLQLTSILAPITQLLDIGNPTLSVYGTLGLKPSDFTIRTSLGVPLKFGGDFASHLKSDTVTLEITGTPTIALLNDVTVQPTDNDKPLDFITSIAIGSTGTILSVTSLHLAGTMKGTWTDPLGIQGISISNCALQMDFSLIEAGLISGFGITGSVTIGSTKVGVGFYVKETFKGSYIYGEVANLYLSDILSWIGLGSIPVPTIGIKDIKLYIVANIAPISIGALILAPGINFVCNVIFGALTLNSLIAAKAFPPAFKLSVQEDGVQQLQQAIDNSGKSILSHNMCSSILYAYNEPLRLASITSSVKNVAHDVTSTVTSAASTAASAVTSAASTAASAVTSAVSSVLNAFLDFQLTDFTISIDLKAQSINVQILWHGKTFGFSYSMSLLGDFTGLIKTIANDIINTVKGLV